MAISFYPKGILHGRDGEFLAKIVGEEYFALTL